MECLYYRYIDRLLRYIVGLFFDILSAINNPNQQGSVDQLSAVMNTAQQLGGSHGLDASTTQTVLSALGGLLRPALQQQLGGAGGAALGGLLGQAAGANGTLNPTTGALQSFLTPQLQQQFVQAIAQRTGLPVSTLQAALPGLISIALGFLHLGSGTSGTPGSNPVLSTFLNSDRDGGADLGDVFKFADRFLNPAL